jgi:hypothetical protein
VEARFEIVEDAVQRIDMRNPQLPVRGHVVGLDDDVSLALEPGLHIGVDAFQSQPDIFPPVFAVD